VGGDQDFFQVVAWRILFDKQFFSPAQQLLGLIGL